MQVEYTEYISLKIKFVYLDELYVIDHPLETKTGSFEMYDGNPSDKNYSIKINAYYRRHLISPEPKLIFSDFYYKKPTYFDKYNDIIEDALFQFDDIDIITVTKEKCRKVKNPRLRFVDPEP